MTPAPQGNKPDVFTYHTPDELDRMDKAEVEALWDLVPTERQRVYKAAYDRARREDGAFTDALELQLIDSLLKKYQDIGLVPMGTIWVETPASIRQIAMSGSDNRRAEADEMPVKANRPPRVMIGLVVGCMLLFGLMFARNLGSRSSQVALASTGTVTPTPTLTPVHSPTPTPLALDAQDSIIRGGDAGGALYPVNLRISLGNEAQPRIFVVQRRVIQTTEWNYEDNPDTASYLSGLVIRPVLGIPWSAENAALFEQMQPGANLVLQMNTGAALRFQVTSHQVVNRSDTSWFRQVGPGLVLVLIGERNPETREPTSNRVIIVANFLFESERPRGILAGVELPKVDTPTPTLTPTPIQRFDVQLIAANTAPGWVQIRLRIYNGRYTQASFDSRSIWLTYGYVAHPVGPHMAAELQPFAVEPGQAVDLTLVFAWHGEPFATLGVLDAYEFALTFKQETR